MQVKILKKLDIQHNYEYNIFSFKIGQKNLS
jgi:hypothetical protein